MRPECTVLNLGLTKYETAWGLQNDRRVGECIPKNCLNPKFLLYRDVALYGEQVERLFAWLPKSQIKIFTFEEFVGSVKDVYEEILLFLGVPADGRGSFPRINENKAVRSRVLAKLVTRPPQSLLWAVAGVKKLFGVRHLGVSNLYLRLNKKSSKRKAVSSEFRIKLTHEFLADINKLERLVDKDLSKWKC